MLSSVNLDVFTVGMFVKEGNLKFSRWLIRLNINNQPSDYLLDLNLTHLSYSICTSE